MGAAVPKSKARHSPETVSGLRLFNTGVLVDDVGAETTRLLSAAFSSFPTFKSASLRLISSADLIRRNWEGKMVVLGNNHGVYRTIKGRISSNVIRKKTNGTIFHRSACVREMNLISLLVNSQPSLFTPLCKARMSI
jgi:hypothetical protein